MKYSSRFLCACLLVVGLTFSLMLTPSLNVIASAAPSSSLTVGLVSAGPIIALNPFFPGGQSAVVISQLTGLIYESLLLQSPNGTLMPQLAKSWSVNSNATVFVFNLRSGLRWSDGTPLNASDVAYTFNVFRSNSLLDAFNGFIVGPLIKNITVLNSTAVEFTLTHPYSLFLEYAGLGKVIVPEHVYSKLQNITSFTNSGSPVGDGPYMLVNWTPGSSVLHFVPNPDYYGVKPKIQNLFVQILSPTANIPALIQTGEIDLAQPSPSQVSALKGMANINVVVSPGISIFGTYFEPAGLLMFDDALYPYNLTAVRQAIAYSINRSQVVELGLDGFGVPGNQGQLPPSLTQWIPPNLPNYTYNPAKAKALLVSAGFKMGSNGYFEFPNGSVWAPTVMDTGGAASSIVSVVVQDLRSVGVDASESVVTLGALVQALEYGNFNMVLLQTSRPPIPGFVLGVFASNVSVPVGQQEPDYHGWTRWVNLTFWDDLQGAQIAGSFTSQYALYSNAQTILASQEPLVTLYYGESIWAYSNASVQGWGPAQVGYQFPQAPLLTSLYVPSQHSSTGGLLVYAVAAVVIVLVIVGVAILMLRRR